MLAARQAQGLVLLQHTEKDLRRCDMISRTAAQSTLINGLYSDVLA